jgi:hypothetical protein
MKITFKTQAYQIAAVGVMLRCLTGQTAAQVPIFAQLMSPVKPNPKHNPNASY